MIDFIFNDFQYSSILIASKEKTIHTNSRLQQYYLIVWRVGIRRFCSTAGFSYDIRKDECKYDTEPKAILHGLEWLKRQIQKKDLKSGILIKLLNETVPQTRQLSLF